MKFRSRRIASAIALTLAFSTSQIYIAVGFADPGSEAANEIATTTPQQAAGVLSTSGNNPITVNGVSSASGATILTGATIETPGGVSASIGLGNLGSLEIEQNAKLSLSFDQSGIRVVLTSGCVTLRTVKGTTGEINTGKGVAKSNPAVSDVLRICHPDSVATAPSSAGGSGLSNGAIAAIVVGGTAAVIGIALATRGDNPSPSGP